MTSLMRTVTLSKSKSKSKNHLFDKTISIDTIHSLELYIVRRLILRNKKCSADISATFQTRQLVSKQVFII